MDIRELVRHMQGNASDRAVARETGVDRRTVKQYRQWAASHGLLSAPLPSMEELQVLVKTTLGTTPPPQNVSSVEPYREVVSELCRAGVEIAAIYQRLRERGYLGSYSSVRRFVRVLEPRSPEGDGTRRTPARRRGPSRFRLRRPLA